LQYIRLSAVIAALALPLIAGCGNATGAGGGNGGGTAALGGIWTGTATQTQSRAIGDVTRLQIEFMQSGANVTGTVVTTDPTGIPSFGSVTGSVSGNTFTASVDNGSAAPTLLSGTINGTGTAGTYSVGSGSAGAGGTFSITKSVGVTTANVAGTWTGTSQKTGQAAQSLTITFVQSVDSLTFTGNSGSAFSGNGAVIGNSVTLLSTDSSGTTVVNATVAGNTMTGTASNSTGGTQTITLTRGSA